MEEVFEMEMYMMRAIELAKRGEGWCHPNPMVGAVIVKDGRIIGEGWHEKCGELHAERNAIKNLTEPADGATIYVTLEPCCHYGKTPPCTEAIIEKGIARVVIGSRDPNPKVAGGGVKALKQAGIEVIEDFMREECDELNPVFFHYISTGKPFVTLKYAMTLDGKIATRTGESKWISGEESREYVHFLRHARMGIMVGIGTVLADDPMLNVRLSEVVPRHPLRIVCDSKLRIPEDSNLVKTAKKIDTIVACAFRKENDIPSEKKKFLEEAGVRIINMYDVGTGKVDIRGLLTKLGKEGMDSILIEGGGGLNEACLKADVVDEICAFIAPKIFGGSALSPVQGEGVCKPRDAYMFNHVETEYFGGDIMLRYVKEKLCSQV